VVAEEFAGLPWGDEVLRRRVYGGGVSRAGRRHNVACESQPMKMAVQFRDYYDVLACRKCAGERYKSAYRKLGAKISS